MIVGSCCLSSPFRPRSLHAPDRDAMCGKERRLQTLGESDCSFCCDRLRGRRRGQQKQQKQQRQQMMRKMLMSWMMISYSRSDRHGLPCLRVLHVQNAHCVPERRVPRTSLVPRLEEGERVCGESTLRAGWRGTLEERPCVLGRGGCCGRGAG